jgi:16S rRNA (adenine1518-N6/adenine1519-N6)-dimethyltransferase
MTAVCEFFCGENMMQFPTKSHIRSLGIRPRKSCGQNFLIDESLAEKTVAQAGIRSGDCVVEIGPGPGALTFFLAQQGARVHCFEIDRELCAMLMGQYAAAPVSLYNQDILRADFESLCLPGSDMILVGSIPYNITSRIVLKFFETARLFRSAVLIVQKEFAERLCAAAGSRDYGILSVLAQAYAPPRYLFTLAATCFYPQPDVDSAAIMLVPDTSRDWMEEREVFFQKVVRAAFSTRRKKLKNCLKALLGDDPAHALSGLSAVGIDLDRRAETLALAEFYVLADFLREL